MPYISRTLLKAALEALKKGYSPLLTVSLPCMLGQGIPTSGSMGQAGKEGIEYGSAQERAWLESYFKPGGGPPDRPWFIPGTGQWVRPRYAETSLQRRRKDFEDTVFYHPTDRLWSLRKNAAKVLKDKALEGKPPIPIVALALWMWRDRELASLKDLVDKFVTMIGLNRDGLIGTVYSTDIGKEFEDAGLAENPMTTEILAELIGAVPPPPKLPGFTDLVTALEGQLARGDVVVVPGLVSRVLGGWLVGDIVVLVGPPGSGKTLLATGLGKSLEIILGQERFRTVFIEVNRDFDVAGFLGYENLAGEFTAGRFGREVLLTGGASDPRLVVLDEWNLAQIDTYFAPILSVIETGKAVSLPGRIDVRRLPEGEDVLLAHPELEEGVCALPGDTLFIATCNSWVDEPETRLPISGPVKRRCRIVSMPNLLELAWVEKGAGGIEEICNTILRQEQLAVRGRGESGRPSIWDSHRASRLEAIGIFANLDERTRQKLTQLSRALLENPTTKNMFTIGLLRDVFLACVYAQAGDEFNALGQQVADKILHQIQGESGLAETLIALSRDFPNHRELTELAKRMGALSGAERRLKPLL